MRIASCLIAASCALTAADQSPFLVLGGWSYLNPEARTRTTDEGIHAGVVTFLNEAGLIGLPCLDVDLRHASGDGNSLISVGASYVERFALDTNVYAGLGVGSAWHRVQVKTDGEDIKADRYRIQAKGVLGYRVTDRVVVEAQYHHSGIVAGVDTAGATLSLGWWF